MDTLLHDLRHAVRGLARTPWFTIVALVTLALGIGANTAIFSIVNGVILRPLGYPRPEQLMYVTTQFPGLGFTEFLVSPPEYFELQEFNRSFTDVGAYTTGEVNLTAGDRALRVRSASVDHDLLNVLGVRPAQGRVFADGEADVSGPPPQPGPPAPLPPAIAILSHELWQTAFGGRGMVGQTVEVNGRRHEVVGIMPPGADVMDYRTQIWLPLGLNPANRRNRGAHFLQVIARLKDDVPAEAAQAELETLNETWGERITLAPGTDHVFLPPTAGNDSHFLQMWPLAGEVLGQAGRAIWMLQAAVGLVLLIACTNLANLLLARAETRHREHAVRTALGATRGRLLRQFMTEAVLLSVAGGLLGLLLARIGLQVLIRAYPTSLPRAGEIAVDPVVLLFTMGASVATGLLFGLAPVALTRVRRLAPALNDGGTRGAAGGVRHHVRRGLVTVEVALAVMLVLGAGLLVRSVYNLASVDAGFDRSRLVTFSMTLPQVTYPQPSARVELYQRLLATLRAVPGVQAVTAMSGLPPSRQLNAIDTDIDNYEAQPEGPFENVDYYQYVTSDYFETMGIPVVAGRGFERADAASSGMVAIVNETLADTFWSGQNPIGQRLRPDFGDQVPWFTVIGVAKDVKQGGVDQQTGTEAYFLAEQLARTPVPPAFAPGTMNVVLRTGLPLTALSPTIERVVREADPAVPVVRLREMERVFAEAIQRPRLLAQLIGAFAGLALLLAGIGVYGVLSYMVAERRREIGIRMALGAGRTGVLAHVMKQGFVFTFIGAVIGLAGALALGRLIEALLFGVQPTDAGTLAAVVAAIAFVAMLACWLPAWRASRVDPIVALRAE